MRPSKNDTGRRRNCRHGCLGVLGSISHRIYRASMGANFSKTPPLLRLGLTAPPGRGHNGGRDFVPKSRGVADGRISVRRVVIQKLGPPIGMAVNIHHQTLNLIEPHDVKMVFDTFHDAMNVGR